MDKKRKWNANGAQMERKWRRILAQKLKRNFENAKEAEVERK